MTFGRADGKRVEDKYEEYWQHQTWNHQQGYERNLVLEELFQHTERILDLASGDGYVSAWLARRGMSVVAFDISRTALVKAEKRGVTNRVRGTVEFQLPFKSATFDTVFWGDNIEHLFAPAEVLSEVHRVLVRGGRVVISCPNMSYWGHRLRFFLSGRLPKTEGASNPPWAWEHIRFFNSEILSDMLRSYGFDVYRILGVQRDRVLRSRTSVDFLATTLVVTARKQ